MWRCNSIFSLVLATLCAAATVLAGGGRAEFWVDLLRAEPVEQPEEMWADLRESDVIFLGENHQIERHHRIEVDVLREILKGNRPVVLGLEQIERRDQDQLDRYNAGELSFEGLAEAIKWKDQWTNYSDYRPLLEAARKGGARIVGLNAPRDVIHAIGRSGLDALPVEKRRSLPEKIHLEDPAYERLLDLLLGVHASFDPAFLRHVYEAQVARDETMAETITKALQPSAGAKKPIGLVVTGAGHVQYGLGTAERVRLRMPDARDRILLLSESGDEQLTPKEKAMSRPITILHQDIRFISRPAGDYLYVKEIKPDANP
jgi:uncharacterized iron-regulated protein